MNTSARNTTNPNTRAASFRRRFAADLIHLIELLLIAWAFFVFKLGFPKEWPERHFDVLDYSITFLWTHWNLWLMGVIYTIATAMVVNGVFRKTLGRTPGEHLLGIQLLAHHGGGVGFVRSIARSLGACIGFALLGGGYLWAICDPRRQSLAEYVSGTMLMEAD